MLHNSNFTEMNDSNNNTQLYIEECKEPFDGQYDCIKVEVTPPEDEETISETETQQLEEINFEPETESPALRSFIEAHINPILGKFASNDQSPMTIACMSGCLPVVKYFAFNTTVDINQQDKDGNTALMLAAQGGHINVIRFLLWNYDNIIVDAENHIGVTALMKTALRGHSLCARVLILAGADIEKRDRSRNFRAQEWALLCGFKQTAKVIKNIGAAGPLYISRKAACQELKQSKFGAAREMCSTVKRRISRTFRGNRRNWTDDVGTLFYLVDSTTQSTNALWHITWDRTSLLAVEEGETSSSSSTETTECELKQITEQNSTIFASSHQKKKNSFRKYSAKEIPEITCTDMSPRPHRKIRYMQKQSRDKNMLQIPSRRRKQIH